MKGSNSSIPGWLTFALLVAFIFSSIAVLVFAYLTFRVVVERPLNPMDDAVAELADVNGGQEVSALAPVIGLPTPTLVPTRQAWGGTDRVNLLLLGIDRRPGEAFVSRTDSMMIASIDPKTQAISILSVPRDLYVTIPGQGQDRINTAFVYGSSSDDPEAGASLVMETVAYNLGIPIDHYVLVDFSAVTKGIDILGGIDVYLPQALEDPTYPDMDYGYDPLYIPAGSQHLDGELALKYARTRHADSDFGRASRQQQVILSARSKALSLGVGGLLLRAPSIYSQLESGVKTDLSIEQLIALATTVSEIPEENIRNEVLGYEYVSSYLTEAGSQVLILNNELAGPLIQQMFFGE